jgi:hypothetical protein
MTADVILADGVPDGYRAARPEEHLEARRAGHWAGG